jgi:hypothetical protein
LDDEEPSYFHGFGIRHYTGSGADARLADQVRVVWHGERAEKDEYGQPIAAYIVELKTTSPSDRLLLACIEPGQTMQETVARVQAKLAAPFTQPAMTDAEQAAVANDPTLTDEQKQQWWHERRQVTAELNPLESLAVPVLDFDVLHTVEALVGRTVLNGPATVRGLPIIDAFQRIRFRLDRTGADLESEAGGAIFGHMPRDFAFERPFLVLIQNTQSGQPVFACWIGNEDLFRVKQLEIPGDDDGYRLFQDKDE